MSPPISSAIKERVIQLYLEGKGRNEIAQTLNHSHIRISQGSVTNILRTYKADTSQAPTKATTDFPTSEPTPSPSQLQTSPTTETKAEDQIPLSEGPAPSQEALSIEDATGPEEPIKPAWSDQVQQESFMDLGWSMVFEQVMQAKQQLRERTLLIEQKEKDLEQQRMQVDRARYDLEIREIKLLEAEPLIPIARQLQDLGTDINQFLPWVETIHEKAQAENIPTLTKAAYSLAQDLRMYRQLGGLKKSIQLTTQQLEMLNMSLQKQQQAIMTLVNLQSAGISDSEIV